MFPGSVQLGICTFLVPNIITPAPTNQTVMLSSLSHRRSPLLEATPGFSDSHSAGIGKRFPGKDSSQQASVDSLPWRTLGSVSHGLCPLWIFTVSPALGDSSAFLKFWLYSPASRPHAFRIQQKSPGNTSHVCEALSFIFHGSWVLPKALWLLWRPTPQPPPPLPLPLPPLHPQQRKCCPSKCPQARQGGIPCCLLEGSFFPELPILSNPHCFHSTPVLLCTKI